MAWKYVRTDVTRRGFGSIRMTKTCENSTTVDLCRESREVAFDIAHDDRGSLSWHKLIPTVNNKIIANSVMVSTVKVTTAALSSTKTSCHYRPLLGFLSDRVEVGSLQGACLHV